jgi:N-methylhydantoinase A/oxoprolinase/acetone carboxylase beta subunit
MISIAVDIGGTFTDVVAADASTGRYYTAKVPSTPRHLVDAVREGALRVLELAGGDTAAVERFVHGTTVGTNAVLEQKGAVTAILTTAGFEDVLELGRLKRTAMYDVFMEAETPVFLAPKRRRRGIPERIGADGAVVTPLDEDAVRAVVRELRDAHDVEAFAVCLLFSFRNPAHELRVRELVHELDSGLGVSLSSEVDPMFREYERTVVTAFDAYLRPVIERYVLELAEELRGIGITTPLQIMQSRGGITSAELVARKPVSVLLSGPAAGVIGGKVVGERAGFDHLITIDIGGTSADISLIASSKPLISTEGRIDRYPLRVPMVDVNTIGAGGGSVAWVDAAGGFRVGPHSAGSDPGPACYGRGGTAPTVTDASVVLGYLNPEFFAGGTLSLDRDAAHAAVAALADRLGLSVTDAAAGIHRVVNSKMADEVRLVSIRRGYDPRQFALVPLGGAGPVHGGRLAAELAIPTLLVPPVPGVLSALGLLVANVEHDHAETVALGADEAEPAQLEDSFARLAARVAEKMALDRVPADEVETTRTADVRYVGQSYTLEVPVAAAVDERAIADVTSAFHAAHERVYGYATPQASLELVNLRVVQSWGLPRPALGSAPANATGEGPGARAVFFEELGDYVETPVHRRDRLRVQDEIVGPAIVEQTDTTLVIYPGQRATVHESGSLVIAVPARTETTLEAAVL